jgi:restriction endonuclease Mrr
MLPVLLASADGEVRVSDVVDRIAETLGLTPEERGELLPSGKQALFNNRVHWAKTFLGKAGLIAARILDDLRKEVVIVDFCRTAIAHGEGCVQTHFKIGGRDSTFAVLGLRFFTNRA